MLSSLVRLLKRSRTRRDADQEYPCGPCSIVLPADHKLPEYQRRHPRYDRFLPHLARFVPDDSTVIDVGANCGDTVAAMAGANPRPHYLCIEPDPAFFGYLERNLKRLEAARPGLRVKVERALVGRQVQHASLEGHSGTRHAREASAGHASTTLDRIVEGSGLPPPWLLKSDVDGFDYDVIDSAEGIIARHQPALFFECQPLSADQMAGFAATVARLASAGYTRWAAFDNYGELMLRQVEPAQIEQLMAYVRRQDEGLATRTFYYCDILAGTDRDSATLESALDSYGRAAPSRE
ncbi:MAG: FkbM family methyltransferase [Burkholderiales bacterium]|nr:FkbM family methyltransferase [Burkholderiales bacterium]MDE2396070.1 FkbM family methyltransferase [Burkholderiales bacterium]MDE2455769.1 FkbM family methyltransferase [Burkholderiales bacterium]